MSSTLVIIEYKNVESLEVSSAKWQESTRG